MIKFKNAKATGKNEVTGEGIKGGGDMVVGCLWRLVIWPLREVLCQKTGGLL